MDELYTTRPFIRRRPEVILSRHIVPYNAALTFNAGVLLKDGKYIMIFRNDYGDYDAHRLDGTNLGYAESGDGIKWDVAAEPYMRSCGDGIETKYCAARIEGLREDEIIRVYDPRLSFTDGRYILSLAADTRHGVTGLLAESDDLRSFRVLTMTAPDNRNIVLFGEKIADKYLRLERPMPVYSRGRDRFDIWVSESPDLVYWGKPRLLFGVEDVPFANDKIGPGAPPIKTERGWLVIYHAVDIDASRGKNGWETAWKKRYTIGAALLDLNDPSKVTGLPRVPLIVPEGDEITGDGFRMNALFPCAALDINGTLRVYFSVGDKEIRAAECPMSDVLDFCENG